MAEPPKRFAIRRQGESWREWQGLKPSENNQPEGKNWVRKQLMPFQQGR